MSINFRAAFCIVITVLMTLLSGCAGQQSRTKSSLVDYLYPKGSTTAVQPSIPTLNIPLKVGIAFVPEQPSNSRGMTIWSGVVGGGALTEADKTDLLKKVADNFSGHDFVSDIEVIPSAYLTAGGGFANLEQIKTMYGIDLIALVSYDQVQFTDEGLLSLSYWTLVGAYIISGEKNDTSTMLDTAVYDIQSKSLLFRAPGSSSVKGRSTPINLSEELRLDSLKGFEEASANMVANLAVELKKFKQKIKQNPEQANVVHRAGYTGGAVGALEMIMLALIAAVLYPSRRRKIA